MDESPVKFTVKKRKVEDLSEETKKHLKRKHKQYIAAMSKKFAESVAPAQADKLLCSLVEDENDEELSNDLDYVLNLYNKSDSVGTCYFIFNWS